ncbi:MAG: hypothetical protein KJO61_03040 [Deltaproteobacteria bacterium]|nr:hypothetical protein [Deltaproteobacteria bacterium]NNK84400.1 hypothetical protein [Desulfobacterales bacterium]
MSDVVKNVYKLAEALGIPGGFYFNLIKQDDWSSIIKLHALLEAAITYLIVEATNNKKLEDIFSRLELSNLKTGKLAFARKYDLLDKQTISFIRTISEIRNECVHKIGNIGLKLDKYVSSLNKDKRNNFYSAMLVGTPDQIDINGQSISVKEFVSENPKQHIWYVSMYLLEHIYLSQQTAAKEHSYAEFARNIVEESGNVANAKVQIET